jgi:hypothetical protein
VVLGHLFLISQHLHGAGLALYRANMKQSHQLTQDQEKEDDEEWEKRLLDGGQYTRTQQDKIKMDKEKDRKRRSTGEKKTSEIVLLDFMRQVVLLTVKKHHVPKGKVVSQADACSVLGHLRATQLKPGGKLTRPVLETVRYDIGDHLPRNTKEKGVCKECRKHSFFRCIRCKVSLHAECFYLLHTPEHLRVEVED